MRLAQRASSGLEIDHRSISGPVRGCALLRQVRTMNVQSLCAECTLEYCMVAMCLKTLKYSSFVRQVSRDENSSAANESYAFSF